METNLFELAFELTDSSYLIFLRTFLLLYKEGILQSNANVNISKNQWSSETRDGILIFPKFGHRNSIFCKLKLQRLFYLSYR